MKTINQTSLFFSAALISGLASVAAQASVTSTIVNSANSLCMADPSSSTSLYTQQVQWSCDGAADDDYEFSQNSDGSYVIKNAASQLCVDVLSWSTNTGAAIGQYTCNGASNQNFSLISVASGVYQLKSASSGLCLSFNGSNSNGTGLVQEVCGGSGQNFKIAGISGSSSSPSPSPSPTSTSSSNSLIPSNAIAVSNLQTSSFPWKWNHDAGTPGSSQGWVTYLNAPSSGAPDSLATKYYTQSYDDGGEIYHVSFANDENATHFVYDTQIYVTNPSANANIEMDMNQVLSDGATVIYGFQCSSYAGYWQYTYTSGGNSHWANTNVPCNPKKWAANTWHHVQIFTHRYDDSTGHHASYDYVTFDGVTSKIGITAPDGLYLGWSKGDLLLNYQIDGASPNGTTVYSTTYIDQMKVYRW